MVEKKLNYTYLFCAIIGLLSIYRVVMLYHINPNFYVDEAYYWIWSQKLDFGYYSKPPMVAWFIYFAQFLFGDSSLVFKTISVMVYPITSLVIFLTALKLFDLKVAFYAGLLFFTMPGISLSSFIISTDVVLLLFWSLALLFFVIAIETDKMHNWILAGIFGGLGLLSKYNMIIFVLSAVIFFLWSKKYLHILKGPKFYISVIVAFCVFLPNLIWNYQNNFVSFTHVQEISQIDRELFHFDKLLEFFVAQFGVFGLLSFGMLLFIVYRSAKNIADEKFKMLLIFTLLFLFIISVQAFLSRAFANWAAPAYIAASILCAYYFVNVNKIYFLKFAVIINLVLMMAMYHYEDMMKTFGVELTKKTDPLKRVRGWDKLGQEVSKIAANYPNHLILANDRNFLSEIIFYSKPHLFNAKIFNPEKKVQNYFHQTQDLNQEIGKDFIYFAGNNNCSDMAKYFDNVKFIGEIEIKVHKDYSLKYFVFELKKFKGY